MSEFDLIQRFFTRPTPGTVLGVGDDAALMRIEQGMELAVSTDMLVSGTHFLHDTDPFMLGHKTLAVNLSDLAAMGAKPRWALLSLALPSADTSWLERFSAGFFALAEQHGVELVGGDTTRGPLNLCVTIMGEVPYGKALSRSGAQLGDDIWVSGHLGDAALALSHLQGRISLPEQDFLACTQALYQPTPRINLGLALRNLANSAIDISDGLLADLGHILENSGKGALLWHDALPVSNTLLSSVMPPLIGDKHLPDLALRCVLAGGDDYELCFTAAVSQRGEIEQLSTHLELPLTRVGNITAGHALTVYDAQGKIINIGSTGYDHFN